MPPPKNKRSPHLYHLRPYTNLTLFRVWWPIVTLFRPPPPPRSSLTYIPISVTTKQSSLIPTSRSWTTRNYLTTKKNSGHKYINKYNVKRGNNCRFRKFSRPQSLILIKLLNTELTQQFRITWLNIMWPMWFFLKMPELRHSCRNSAVNNRPVRLTWYGGWPNREVLWNSKDFRF